MSEAGDIEVSAFTWDDYVPPEKFMRVQDLAKFLTCSSNHILNLIRSGDIEVPPELQKSAPSGPAMRIPRASIVDFCKRRSSSQPQAVRKFKYNPASKRKKKERSQ